MAACNRFGESVVHMACRRSTYEVVDFILSHIADLRLMDDYGRCPLHDACWRADPDFNIVSLILSYDVSLLLVKDCRGFTPLKYVRPEHWLQWCVFLFLQKDIYWPRRDANFLVAPLTKPSLKI